MGRGNRWQVVFGLGLVALSAILYGAHYLWFHDFHHILIYLVGDIAFVPIEVLLVTLIIHQLLHRRERRAFMQKLNMVIGVFFSEAGFGLLERLHAGAPEAAASSNLFEGMTTWSDEDFDRQARVCRNQTARLNASTMDLSTLCAYLTARRSCLLRMLENPNLLEHEDFTDLLWAVFHLLEELAARPDFAGLPDSDLRHLSGDMNRVYGLLLAQWIAYMKHLKNDYPYLFSLAIRQSPFAPGADPVVR